MQFVKAVVGGETFVYMDLEGLVLGIRDKCAPGEANISEAEVQRLMERIQPFLMFKTKTYNVLTDSKDGWKTRWGFVYGQVNRVLAEMSDDDRRVIAETLISIHCDILEHMALGADLVNTLLPLTQKFSQQILDMDRKTDLVPRLEDYVRRNIPIPEAILDAETSLNKPQHSEKMTFRREHVFKMTACGLLSKLLSPVFGVYIESCKKQLDGSLKDLHCAGMLKDVLDYRYRDLILKFQNFLTQIITKEVQKNTKIKTTLHGHTVGMMAQQQYAGALVRNLVRVDMYRPNGNIMIFLTTCCKDAVKAPPSSKANKIAIEELHGPQEMTSNDEGNMTALECGAQPSLTTVDTPCLIRFAAEKLINSLVVDYDLDMIEYEECLSYYRIRRFPISPLNLYLISIAYCDALGGARSVSYLTADECMTLITLLQFRISKISGLEALAVAMSLDISERPKTAQTKKDGLLKSTWNTSSEYRNCMLRFQITAGDLCWNSQLQEIVQWLLVNDFVVRLPEPLANLTGYINQDGQSFDYPDNIAQLICQFILMHTGD